MSDAPRSWLPEARRQDAALAARGMPDESRRRVAQRLRQKPRRGGGRLFVAAAVAALALVVFGQWALRDTPAPTASMAGFDLVAGGSAEVIAPAESFAFSVGTEHVRIGSGVTLLAKPGLLITAAGPAELGGEPITLVRGAFYVIAKEAHLRLAHGLLRLEDAIVVVRQGPALGGAWLLCGAASYDDSDGTTKQLAAGERLQWRE